MVWVAVGVLLVLLATMPIRVMIAYSMQGASVRLKIGFLSFSVFPGKGKKKQKKKDKEETKSDKPAAADGKKNEKAQKPKPKITDYLPIVRLIIDLLNRLRSKLVIKRFDLLLILGGGDPCDLAVQYGRTQGVFAVLMGQLENVFHIRNRDVHLACDFTADKTVLEGFVDVSITFGKLLYLVVKYGIMILREYFAISNNKKAVQ